MELRPRKTTSSDLSGFHWRKSPLPGPDWLCYAATTSFVTSGHFYRGITNTGSQEVASDTELLAIADTLISLGAQHAAVADPHPSVLTSHPPTHARSAATEKALES